MADVVKKEGVLKASAAAFKIIPLTSGVKWLNMLVYGPYGSGKTTLAASACDVDTLSDVLMLDIESGAMALEDNDRVSRKDRIDRIPITSFQQMAKAHEFLKAHCRYRDDPNEVDKLKTLEARFKGCEPEDITEPKRYHTVMVDSLSELDQLTQYELLGFKIDMPLNKALNDGDMEVADWPIFRKNNQMMQLIVRAYRDLPINVTMICHAAYTQDELKRMFYAPGLTGKLSGQVQGFVDVVGYLTVGKLGEGEKEAPRRLYVQPVGKFDAKNRKASYKESYFDNPTMSSISKALKLGVSK